MRQGQAGPTATDMVILMLTDVLQEGSQAPVPSAATTPSASAFAVEPKDHDGCSCPSVMSRKKQVVPMLTTLWG